MKVIYKEDTGTFQATEHSKYPQIVHGKTMAEAIRNMLNVLAELKTYRFNHGNHEQETSKTSEARVTNSAETA